MRDDTVALWIVFSAIVLLCVGGTILTFVKRHRTNQRILKEWETPTTQPPLIEQHVYIVEKYVVSKVVGYKTPKHSDVYHVLTKSDNGRTKDHVVDKEIYETIPEHTFGTLAFIGTRVYGYCED